MFWLKTKKLRQKKVIILGDGVFSVVANNSYRFLADLHLNGHA